MHARSTAWTDLVALGVAGLTLFGLLAPAILSAREEAARKHCSANLATITRGVHAYADAHNGATPRTFANNGGVGWMTSLLPYIGEDGVYARYKLELPFSHADNAPAVSTRIAAFECPEIRRADRMVTIGESKDLKAGPTDYVGLVITTAVQQLFPPDFDRSGALSGSLREIPDGLAFTGMVFESADKNHRWQGGKQLPGESGQAGAWAGGAANGYRGYSFDGVQVPGPCAVNCNNSTGVYGFHPGGAYVGMADQSVRFMNDRMDVMVMYAIVTRNGGEMLSDSDF